MNAWTNSPDTTVIGDFEYSTGLLETLRHQAIFEFALANAHGKWIVPPTAINHRMSKQEFAERLMSAQVNDFIALNLIQQFMFEN